MVFVKYPADVILDTNLMQFEQEGGSIGRAEHCEILLEDSTQQISKIHALIHFRDDMYFITDVSTNGVFVNDNAAPIGKGNTKQILEGERFSIGEYVVKATYVTPELAVDNKAELFEPAVLEENNELESLLSNNDDISDLLDIEVELSPESDEIFAMDDTVNIDKIISHIDAEKEVITFEMGTDAEVDTLLSSNNGSNVIDVLADNDNRDLAEKTFSNVLSLLENYASKNDRQSDIIMNVREYLLEHKNQIIGSS